MFVFIYKWLKNAVLRRTALENAEDELRSATMSGKTETETACVSSFPLFHPKMIVSSRQARDRHVETQTPTPFIYAGRTVATGCNWPVRKRYFRPLLYSKLSFCQDRLGTN
jgi:hypothetical protein